MIVRQAGRFLIKSKKGRNLGKFSSRKAAERRLKQIEYFKHVDKKSSSPKDA